MSKQTDLINIPDAITVSGSNVGIGETVPLGKLHVKTADSGATVDVGADELVIEGSGNAGMSILSGASNTGSIYFGDSGTNWDGYIAYSQNSRSMTFGTAAGGGSMTLDSSGRVTKPNQPAFIVRHTSATNYAGNALVTGPWTVSRNQGNHFNTSNGAFTAPVAGVYQVNLSWNNYYPNGGGHIQVKVNGAVGSGLQFDPLPTSLSPAWFTHTLAGSLYLSANDEVRLQYGSTGGKADNSDWSHWSMYLVG
jgi:hypothetical protein